MHNVMPTKVYVDVVLRFDAPNGSQSCVGNVRNDSPDNVSTSQQNSFNNDAVSVIAFSTRQTSWALTLQER